MSSMPSLVILLPLLWLRTSASRIALLGFGVLLVLGTPQAYFGAETVRQQRPSLGASVGKALDPGDGEPLFDQWLSVLQGGTATNVTLDVAGNIYIIGQSLDGLNVTPNAFQPAYPAGFQRTMGFVMELDPSGTNVLYATYLYGLNPNQVVVDHSGYIYILSDHYEQNSTNTAVSYPAPITANAVQSYPGLISTPTLLKISPDGSLVYATFLGGVFSIQGGALAVDPSGSAVVCGSTADPGLPVSAGAAQSVLNGFYNVFVAKVSPDGSYYEALTYLGGGGVDRCSGLQLDAGGNTYIYGDTSSRFFPVTPGAYQTNRGAGLDLIAAKINPALTEVLWATYIGGNWDSRAQPSVSEFTPSPKTLALSADGSLVFAGSTGAFDFPVSVDTGPPPIPPSGWPLLGVLDPTGSRLTFSYPLPINADVYTIVTGDGKTFFLLGLALTDEFSPLNATLNAQGLDGLVKFASTGINFLARFDLPSLSLSYLGPLREVSPNAFFVGAAVASDGNLILASTAIDGGYAKTLYPTPRSIGGTYSLGYGTVVFDLNFSSEKQPLITSLVNPASLLNSPLTPGELLEIRGEGFSSSAAAVVASDPTNLPLELAGVQVSVDNAPIPLLSVKDNEIVAAIPSVSFGADTSVLSASFGGATADPRTVQTGIANPGIFTAAGIGVGQAVAFNSDGSPNSSQNPAKKGQTITLVATGLGLTPTTSIAGTIANLPAQLNTVSQAPGYPAGCFSVELEIPAGVPEGDFVLVSIAANGATSQPGVTISIR